MNATKFVVVLVIGVVVCAIVTARPLEEISKDTKLGISSTNKATTNGIGAELGTVTADTYSYSLGYGFADAASGPNSVDSYGSGYTSTAGSVTSNGPNAAANSNSGSSAEGGAGAATGDDGAISSGSGSANSGSNAGGSTSD